MIPLNRKTYISFAVGLIFSAVALYFTFVNIPFRDLVDYLKVINYWWIVPALLISLVSYALRIWRWQIILMPVKKSGFWGAFHPLTIGFMLNCIFPGRVGEVARPAIYYKREDVEFSKVLATVGIERIFDALCLIVFFAWILASVTIDPSVEITFAGYHLTPAKLDRLWKSTLQLSVALAGSIVLVSFSRTRAVFRRAIMGVPDILFFASPSFKERVRAGVFARISHALDNFASGLDILKSPWHLIASIVLSFVLWGLLGWSLYIQTFSCPGVNVTFLEAFAVEIIICFFIMLPSVPGYWGLWEAGGVFGLMIFGVPAKEAAGLTLTYHFFHLIPVILIGLVSAMVIGVRIVAAKQDEDETL